MTHFLSSADPLAAGGLACPPLPGAPDELDPKYLSLGKSSRRGLKFDMEAVRRAKQDIDAATDEISRLAKVDKAAPEFFRRLLAQLTKALAAPAGIVWMADASGVLRVIAQVGVSDAELFAKPNLQQQHTKLLNEALRHKEPLTLAPGASLQSTNHCDKTCENITERFVILAPLHVDGAAQGVLEIWQRPTAPPDAVAGYRRFVGQVADIAVGYLKSRRLNSLAVQKAFRDQLGELAHSVHASLDPSEVAYTLANEGRRIIGCDRLSVLVQGRGKLRVEAVSGQDLIDQRSNAIRAITELASSVVATSEPLQFSARIASHEDENFLQDTDAPMEFDSDLPPQLADAVQQCISTTGALQVNVWPLTERKDKAGGEDPWAVQHRTSRRVIGAVVAEQFIEVRDDNELPDRIAAVVEHGELALANALAHDAAYVLPGQKRLAKLRRRMRVPTARRKVAIAATCLAVIGAVLMIPVEFRIQADGVLRPSDRRDIFTAADGVVRAIHVEPGQFVEPGDSLIDLENHDLQATLAELAGRQSVVQTRIIALKNQQLQDHFDLAKQQEIVAELATLAAETENLEIQLGLNRKIESQLHITSPVRGQVASWNLDRQLAGRPLRRGDRLIEIADLSSSWEIDVAIPQQDIGRLGKAQAATEQPLSVEFMLLGAPNVIHEGVLDRIGHRAEVTANGEIRVPAKVKVVGQRPPQVRGEEQVRVRILCGRRALGYVWLYEIAATMRREILFRL